MSSYEDLPFSVSDEYLRQIKHEQKAYEMYGVHFPHETIPVDLTPGLSDINTAWHDGHILQERYSTLSETGKYRKKLEEDIKSAYARGLTERHIDKLERKLQAFNAVHFPSVVLTDSRPEDVWLEAHQEQLKQIAYYGRSPHYSTGQPFTAESIEASRHAVFSEQRPEDSWESAHFEQYFYHSDKANSISLVHARREGSPTTVEGSWDEAHQLNRDRFFDSAKKLEETGALLNNDAVKSLVHQSEYEIGDIRRATTPLITDPEVAHAVAHVENITRDLNQITLGKIAAYLCSIETLDIQGRRSSPYAYFQ